MTNPRRALWFLGALAPIVLLVFFCWRGGSSSAWATEQDCANGPAIAAASNALSLRTLIVAPFGRRETGWAFYEPLIANEIGTVCSGGTPGFARALKQWQAANRIEPSGAVNEATLDRMKQVRQSRRAFVGASRHNCPAPPRKQELERALRGESYGGKTILLQRDALAAFRQMAAAARKAGLIPAGSHRFAIFSGYRSPAYDAARCLRERNCQGIVRARYSPHRTGLALDIYLGAAPGFAPDSSADANRLYISRTEIYRWMVRHASKFGFVNYAFEPWHWEYVENAGGESIKRPAAK